MTTHDSEVNRATETLTSSWDNVYWFARLLLSSEYGGVANNTTLMMDLAMTIRTGANTWKAKPSGEVTELLGLSVRELLLNSAKSGTKRSGHIEGLVKKLGDLLLSPVDFAVLAFTCEKIIVPLNDALKRVPSDDRVYSEALTTALLTAKAEAGIADAIQLWDDVGAHGCMAAERVQIVQQFETLRGDLSKLKLSGLEESIILTAFCQEFERRAGQKRKGRGGRGLESVTSVILEHFGITSTSHAPEHFTTGLEIDRWVTLADKWIIGISCKRTLRERWKQAYTTDLNLLNRHKIRGLWHVVIYDHDLSDDKLTEMGSYRAVFYLRDDSPRYLSAKGHPGMKDYVRPLGSFISDLKELL